MKGQINMRLLQNLVNQTKIIKPEFGVMNENGLILACSDKKKMVLPQHTNRFLDSRDLSMFI